MTEHELRRRFPNAPESFIRRNAQNYSDREAPSPEPKYVVCDDPLAAAQGKTSNLRRVIVRIKSFRTRLLDADNLVGGSKYFTDGLRYARLISGDSEAEILLEVSQQKVKTKAEECTRIEIEPI